MFCNAGSSIFEMIKEVKGDLKDIPVILVGNKCDENDKREVSHAEGEAQVSAPSQSDVAACMELINALDACKQIPLT